MSHFLREPSVKFLLFTMEFIPSKEANPKASERVACISYYKLSDFSPCVASSSPIDSVSSSTLPPPVNADAM